MGGGSNSAFVDLWGGLPCASIKGLVRSLGVIEGLGSLLFFLFAAAYLRLLLPCSYGLPRFRFDENLTMQLGPVGQPSHLGVPLSRETRPSLAPWPSCPWWRRTQRLQAYVIFGFGIQLTFKQVRYMHIPQFGRSCYMGSNISTLTSWPLFTRGLKFNISLPTSREISVVKDFISIVLLLRCWKIADRATALQILYPLPY